MSQRAQLGHRCGGTATCWPAVTYLNGDDGYGHMMASGVPRLFHPLSEPSRLLYDREGSLLAGISCRPLCCSRAAVGTAHWRLAVHHPRRRVATVHIVFNHCRQIRTPGLRLNPPPTLGRVTRPG